MDENKQENTEKAINPLLKMALELGPPILFFILYIRIQDDVFTIGDIEYTGFIFATIIFVPILLASIAALWFLTGKLSRMQIFTAVMVILFGALTAWFNDPRFFKMKTTLVYGFFTVILGIGLLQKKSYLAYVLSEAMPMQHEGWMILTKRLTILFASLAIANEIIWRNMSESTWVTIETFIFPVVMFVFLWVQIMMLQKYMDLDED
ncbi:inner membrane-spanning protein YciB [Parasulfitobacter algicola]|uniref:Inner membrane-spanning protein YciB n=1 Tax=Parasulfitobacter algicola TaxID=2614809 RepID=A0ABX2IT00_9RHOB|nr:inner membrane-spanning protein YciB [Sulfitobacter algicola]NSX56029.1 septation protein IspZ [Sulfitobacter algicola]